MRDITIVIPVRSDPLLARAVASVPPDEEVIIAMTSPPQAAVDLARSLAQGRNLRVEVTSTPGMSAGVNLGARLASHGKIVILDSDCILKPGSLAAYSEALDRYAFVRGVTLVERKGYWSRLAALGTERLNRVFRDSPRLFGPSIAFRKADFLALGGYDEAMVYGSCDHEFALRLEKKGLAVGFCEGAVLVHQPLTFRIDTRSHLGYGRGMAYIDRLYGGSYGLEYCRKRLAPRELWIRAVERGPVSVLRALILGSLMLKGYRRDNAQAKGASGPR